MSDALYELLTRGNELWVAPASVSSFMAKLGVPGDRLGDYIRGDSANLPFVSGCDQFTNLFTRTVPKIRSLFMERRNDRHFVLRVRISLSLSSCLKSVIRACLVKAVLSPQRDSLNLRRSCKRLSLRLRELPTSSIICGDTGMMP